MKNFWVIVGGKPREVAGTIAGEIARAPLPLGGFKDWRWPHWYASKADAYTYLAKQQEDRRERARRLLGKVPEINAGKP